jgi:hypothetical protein
MDTETRSLLLNMKASLSKGWVQGKLGIDEDIKLNEEGVCLFGAAMALGPCRVASGLADEISVENPVKGRQQGTGYVTLITAEEGTSTYSAMDLIAKELNIPMVDVALWNDAPERTHQDIIDVIDCVLLKEKNAEGSSGLQHSGNGEEKKYSSVPKK